ncbi:MAG: HlyD family efflux transporter periplasmic adaptor subunit [Planctomycetes bacterium]|nr:HlyD family efflux transporter periplasmic adaptor subunit [Planctomycetota bacterium]
MKLRTCAFALLGLGFVAAACRDESSPLPHVEQETQPTNRIDVPEIVRRNLGIAFVTVERRRVGQTLRVPGHFELLPSARHEHRVPVAGRVEVLVQPLQAVATGDLLFRIDSPTWRQVQRELGELSASMRATEARFASMQPLVAAHRVHEESLKEAVAVIEARVASLRATQASVGGQAEELATAQIQLAQTRADLAEAAEKEAGTTALVAELQANLQASRDRFDLALAAAATLVSTTPAQLTAAPANALPPWRTITAIEVRATAAGIADKLPVATGVWVETGELVLTVSDLGQVRFRARGLQSDLPRLREGLRARIVLPQGQTEVTQGLDGRLALGVEADPAQRTIDLFVQPSANAPWARPGVAGFLEIELRDDSPAELAIPSSAVLQDGLEKVFFRRDPADPDTVIRVAADLGVDDGRWVEVKSGIKDGDQVVLGGAYELMLASSGSAAKGGHFHSDGTFHAGEEKGK